MSKLIVELEKELLGVHKILVDLFGNASFESKSIGCCEGILESSDNR